jgi:hypothetical protein
VQLPGRAGHMAFMRDGDEVAEVSQFHWHIQKVLEEHLPYF